MRWAPMRNCSLVSSSARAVAIPEIKLVKPIRLAANSSKTESGRPAEASTSWLIMPLLYSDGQNLLAGCAKGALTAAVHGLGLTPTMSIRNGVVSSSAGRMSSTGARRKGAKSFLLGLIPFIGEGRRGANFIKSIVPRYGMGNKQIHFCGE